MKTYKDYSMGTMYGPYDGNEYLSKNFQLKEFLVTEHPEIPNIPSERMHSNLKQLAQLLQIFRDKFGKITITSGYRSTAYQDALRLKYGVSQAAAYSLHEEGLAADITPTGTSAAKMFAAVANDPTLKSYVGEFALKKNTIHMSLPTTTKQSVMMWVDSNDKYNVFSTAELNKFIQDNLTSVSIAGMMLMLAVFGTLGYFLYQRKKAGI